MVIAADPLTIAESALGSRFEIGAGGMAKVFSLPNFFLPEDPGGKWVYKKFRSKVRPVMPYGLRSLVKLFEGFEPKQRLAFEKTFNWPVRVVIDDGDGAAGVILPLLSDELFVDLHLSSGATKRKPAELQFLFQTSAYCAKVGIPFLDDQQRRAICRSLCYAMGLLDRVGVVYGDLSARNVLYRISPRPGVKLVDCDAVRPHGSAAALGQQPHSPDWEPPEAIAAKQRRDSRGYSIQSKETDRYKLGLAILRILTPGQGCAENIDPLAARQQLPMNLYTLLQRSLSDDPHARPTAKTWYEELTR